MAEALNQSVLAAVVSAVRRAVCLPDVQITQETRFSEDLSLDSLDLVELTIELEETFETELPGDAHARFRSVADVTAYFSRRYLSDSPSRELLRAA
jgi:acyl carrier protein